MINIYYRKYRRISIKNIFTFILVINFCLMVSYSNIYAADVYKVMMNLHK